jgi:hypothetical protein
MVNDRGEGFFPHGFFPELAVMMPICRGLGFGWTAAPEVGGILISIFGGNPDEPTDEALATTLSRDGLRALIAGLKSIDKQLGPSGPTNLEALAEQAFETIQENAPVEAARWNGLYEAERRQLIRFAAELLRTVPA